MTEGGPSRGRQAVAQDDDGAGANSLKGTFTDKCEHQLFSHASAPAELPLPLSLSHAHTHNAGPCSDTNDVRVWGRQGSLGRDSGPGGSESAVGRVLRAALRRPPALLLHQPAPLLAAHMLHPALRPPQDIVINYSNGLLRMALDVAAARGRVKPGKSAPGAVVTPDDIAALVRRDPKKITRLKEILSLQEEIAKARQGLEEAVDPAAFVGLNK